MRTDKTTNQTGKKSANLHLLHAIGFGHRIRISRPFGSVEQQPICGGALIDELEGVGQDEVGRREPGIDVRQVAGHRIEG